MVNRGVASSEENGGYMNSTKESRIVVIVKVLFVTLALGVCLYLILGQVLLPKEMINGEYNCKVYEEEWTWVKSDGTRVPVEIPGKCEAGRNEVVVIESVLPEDVENNTYFCIRSSKQEMQIYVDDVLRREYTTNDSRVVGKLSAVAYVFVDLEEEDAGKTIRVVTRTDSSYTGIFHTMYYGEKMAIWRNFLKTHGVELGIAFLMLLLGVISILGSIALRMCYKKRIELEYLGWGVLMAAIWLLANSVFRQLLFANVSTISDIAFYMVMLLAPPFMLYLNGVQNERYHKAYVIACIANYVDFVICTVLHITNTIDFADTIVYMTVIAALSVLLIGVTIIIDIFTGRIREYRLVAVGILGVSVASVAQIVMYFRRTTAFNGSLVALGLVFLLIISAINTVQDVLKAEKEKQQAILSNESKGRFLANMSHEIRTPINVILGMDAVILRESKEAKIREYAMDIQHAGQTLLSLVNDILDFSKIESGKLEIIPVEYDFSSMIHDISNMIAARASDKGLALQVNVESSLPFRLFGDEVRIRQILVNLLVNAVKYTHEGSVTLSISGDIRDNDVILYFSVEDTGIGIKEEDISKLFERFERIEEKRNRNIEGTGLGMSITMQLLDMMDSHLKVESEYGKGSRFSFILKQRIIQAEPIGNLEERIARQSQGYEYEAMFVAPEAHILVVDDNAVNRKVFINLLKETEVQIDQASGGVESLEMIRQKHYDIIFMDHMMPEMDGVEALHHIRQQSDHMCVHTPVVALTANAINGAKEMYLSEGFDDFLAKPVKPEKLERIIKKLLPEELVKYPQQAKVREELPEDTADKITIEDLPQIEGIDWEYAWMNLTDSDLLMDTVHDFYRMIETEADYLKSCKERIGVEEEALTQYRIKVHAMKSSSAMIGAVQLSGVAKLLEYAARDARIDVINAITDVFLEEWCKYKERLQVCIQTEDRMEIEDKSVIVQYLEELQSAIEEMDIDIADERMKQLRQYSYNESVQPMIDRLESAVTDLNEEQVNQLAGEIILEMETE